MARRAIGLCMRKSSKNLGTILSFLCFLGLGNIQVYATSLCDRERVLREVLSKLAKTFQEDLQNLPENVSKETITNNLNYLVLTDLDIRMAVWELNQIYAFVVSGAGSSASTKNILELADERQELEARILKSLDLNTIRPIADRPSSITVRQRLSALADVYDQQIRQTVRDYIASGQLQLAWLNESLKFRGDVLSIIPVPAVPGTGDIVNRMRELAQADPVFLTSLREYTALLLNKPTLEVFKKMDDVEKIMCVKKEQDLLTIIYNSLDINPIRFLVSEFNQRINDGKIDPDGMMNGFSNRNLFGFLQKTREEYRRQIEQEIKDILQNQRSDILEGIL
jgi:hypothetical protein